MNLSLHLPYSVIARHIREQIGDMLFSGEVKDWTGSKSHVEVRREGELRLSAHQGLLCCDIPVHVWLDIRRDDPGLMNLLKGLSGIRQMEFKLLVRITVSIGWANGWALQISASPSFTWLTKPIIGSLLKMEVSSWIEPIMEKKLLEVAKEVEATIAREVDLPTIVKHVWPEIQRPQLFNKDWPMWLCLTLPADVLHRSEIACGKEGISLTLSGDVSAHLDPGPEPKAGSASVPIPVSNLAIPTHQAITSIHWTAELPLSLVSSHISYANGWVSLKEIQLSQAGEQLQAEARVRLGSKWLGLGRQVNMTLRLLPMTAPDYLCAAITELRLPFPFSLQKSHWTKKITEAINDSLRETAQGYLQALASQLHSLPLEGQWVLETTELRASIRDLQMGHSSLFAAGEVSGKVGLRLDHLYI